MKNIRIAIFPASFSFNKFGKEIPRIEHFCVGSVKVEICKILPNLLTSMFSSYREPWNKDRQGIPCKSLYTYCIERWKNFVGRDREVAIMAVSADRRTEGRKTNSNDRKKAWSSLVLQFFCSVVSTVFTHLKENPLSPLNLKAYPFHKGILLANGYKI